eukprot:2769646-Karenia_brevis.AAC.1
MVPSSPDLTRPIVKTVLSMVVTKCGLHMFMSRSRYHTLDSTVAMTRIIRIRMMIDDDDGGD